MSIRLYSLIASFFIVSSLFGQKYDAEVLKYNTLIVADPFAVKTTVEVELLVNNHQGESYGIVMIPYAKSDQVSDISARIEDNSGKIVSVLKKSDILDRNEVDDALYTDYLLKAFYLNYGSYPYKLIYSYTVSERNYYSIAGWSPVLDDEIPTRKASLTLTVPKGFEYKLHYHRIDSFNVDSSGKNTVLKWNSSYLKPIKDEIYSRPESELPHILILPAKFKAKYEGSWSSWIDFGNWICDLNEGRSVLTEQEQAKVTAMISGITDKKEIVKILYYYLQDNTRYINVRIGLGGLQPYPAEYVCKNKYGDCKALSMYMKALLDFVGIKSYYTLINASDPPLDFYFDFPSSQFNHVIVTVPLDNDTIWLENTNKHIPCGYLGSSTCNRPAFLIDRNNSKLVMTPSFNPQSVLNQEKQVYNLNLTGPSDLSLTSVSRGESFEILNAYNGEASDEQFDEFIRKNMWFDNYEVKEWHIIKAGRDQSKIELRANLSINKILNPLGSDYFFSLSSAGIPSFTNPTNRTLPVVIAIPIYNIDTLVYNLPAGYTLKNQSEPLEISSPYGNYKLKITADSGSVKVIREFELHACNLNLEKYPEFYKFIETIKKADKTKIVIKHL